MQTVRWPFGNNKSSILGVRLGRTSPLTQQGKSRSNNRGISDETRSQPEANYDYSNNQQMILGDSAGTPGRGIQCLSIVQSTCFTIHPRTLIAFRYNPLVTHARFDAPYPLVSRPDSPRLRQTTALRHSLPQRHHRVLLRAYSACPSCDH